MLPLSTYALYLHTLGVSILRSSIVVEYAASIAAEVGRRRCAPHAHDECLPASWPAYHRQSVQNHRRVRTTHRASFLCRFIPCIHTASSASLGRDPCDRDDINAFAHGCTQSRVRPSLVWHVRAPQSSSPRVTNFDYHDGIHGPPADLWLCRRRHRSYPVPGSGA